MIMVLSGTKDGRELIEFLLQKKYPLIVTTATSYGGSLMEKRENCMILPKRLSREEMENCIINKKIKTVIDATHPYAIEVSKNAMKACENTKVKYFRFERGRSKLDPYLERINVASSYEEAVNILKKINGNILLTTGSKMLGIFTKGLDKNRLYARVLPMSGVIKSCEDLGLKPSNVIAMQGPFSIEMNMEIIKKYNIDILVSKDSGNAGGTLEKIEASSRMKIPVLLIGRPKIEYVNRYESMEELLKKVSEGYGEILSCHVRHS